MYACALSTVAFHACFASPTPLIHPLQTVNARVNRNNRLVSGSRLIVVFQCSPALLAKVYSHSISFVFILLSRKVMNYSDNRHSHTAVASGYLFKVSHNGTPFARWHRRYYVLYSDGLLYSFKNARSKAFDHVIPVGRMCLRMKFGAETSPEDCTSWPKSVSQKLCFSIINSDRAYHFFCESEREFDSWRQHFLGTLDKLASPSSHWAVDWGDMNVSEKDAASDHSTELCATCPKENAKRESQKGKEMVQIEVESEEDEQLTYDMVVHGYLERHGGVESERGKEEERRGEQHIEPTLGSVSEGNESKAVKASATLDPSVEKASEKETGQGNVQAFQVSKTTNPDVEGEENFNDKRTPEKRTVENSKLDERRTNVANHISLEEQMLIETVDPGMPKIEQLEREVLSLYPEEDESGLELEVEGMIESVFNEITSPPVEYSPRKCKCEEQKLLSNTTQVKRSGGEMRLQHALSSEQTVQVTVSGDRVRDSWSVHSARNKSKTESNTHGYVQLQKEVLTCSCGRRACVYVFHISVPPLPSHTHTHTGFEYY